MTGYHQPAELKWAPSLIILKPKKKEKESGALTEQLPILSHFSRLSLTSNPSSGFQSPGLPQQNLLQITSVCSYWGERVCLCEAQTDRFVLLCFLHASFGHVGLGSATEVYPSCVEDPSTLTGPLYSRSSQAQVDNSHRGIIFNQKINKFEVLERRGILRCRTAGISHFMSLHHILILFVTTRKKAKRSETKPEENFLIF